MSFVTTQPGLLTGAAGNLTGIDSAMNADKVSAPTAAQFAVHAQMYQVSNAQSAAIHEMFVSTLLTSSGSCVATEAANAVAAI